MDYVTKPVTREYLRLLAGGIRKLFEVKQNVRFPVVSALDKLLILFPDVSYSILPDEDMPKKVPAMCQVNDDGIDIQIKNSVYIGADERGVGGYRDHIMHEICHVFLYKLGYTPIMERRLGDKIESYSSVEWQAKALCGEIMIPYEASRDMTVEQIVEKFGVSQDCAKYRCRLK